MSYHQEMRKIARDIVGTTERIEALEGTRLEWTKPEGQRIAVGSTWHHVVRKDGSKSGLEGVQLEMLKVIDRQLLKFKSELEGLRFQMVQLGKTGGAE